MKQLLQNLSTGETVVEIVPMPSCSSGKLLVRSCRSLVSVGTERMLVDFGRANLLDKARQQPDKVKQVLDKAKTDGILPTYEAVRSKLDMPLAMGYSNVGVVESLGHGVDGLDVGARVVSNGHHAEYVCVPQNLCARIPDKVDDETAAFTVLGAIALQGIRLVNPTLGENVVVTGLGLIGLIAVQLLRAHGCRVLGIDYDSSKCDLARQFGAETVDLSKGEDPVVMAERFSRSTGVDAVLITASTKSNEPIHQAATMCRKRGRIVLVGVVGMEMSRADFYEKELSFQVSCSYGPGRYDSLYEDKGQDYPVGFVRWTEQRNFEAVLDMMADGRLDVKPLISHRFAFEQAPDAYELLSLGSPLGILLEYGSGDNAGVQQTVVELPSSDRVLPVDSPRVGFVGAGNYAIAVLIPAFSKSKACLQSVASVTGVSAVHAGKKFGIAEATTDSAELFARDDIDALVITTRHNAHADMVVSALQSGKHVFVEKPLAINRQQLSLIEESWVEAQKTDAKPVLMVGFNRRYAPLLQKMKALLSSRSGPKSMLMTVNAGQIPADHWTQDPGVGGGRIIGEGCHFVDLLRFVVGAPISGISAEGMAGGGIIDTVHINIGFSDGSAGTIIYTANGHRSFPKERLEVCSEGGILQLDNFRSLKGFGWPGFKKEKAWRQDKGQVNCVNAFVDALSSGDASSLIPFEQLLEVSQATFDIVDQIGGKT